MGKPLSIDLRCRLVAAVAGGLSRRSAAERFGVSAASAVRYVQTVTTAGTVKAKPQGGDTRSHRIEAFSSVILAAVAAQKDISLVELTDLLRTEHGASFRASTVWRCLDRHGMPFKKNGARRQAGAARRRSPAPGLVAHSGDHERSKRSIMNT